MCVNQIHISQRRQYADLKCCGKKRGWILKWHGGKWKIWTVMDGPKNSQRSSQDNNGIMLFSTHVLSAWVSEWEQKRGVFFIWSVSHHLCWLFSRQKAWQVQQQRRFKQRLTYYCSIYSLKWQTHTLVRWVLLLQNKAKSSTLERGCLFLSVTYSLSLFQHCMAWPCASRMLFPIVHYTSSICYSIFALSVMNTLRHLCRIKCYLRVSPIKMSVLGF